MVKKTIDQSWHSISTLKVIKKIKTDLGGLTSKQVNHLLKNNGYNVLPAKKKFGKAKIFFNQIKSPLVYVLLVATIISLILKHFTDAGVIFFVVLLNSLFGFWQENKANDSMEKLNKIVKHIARVRRDGQIKLVDSQELVVGDILLLKSGDKVASDARLIKSNNLQTIESSLTGESAPIEKNPRKLSQDTILADRKNMVFMSTLVSRGTAEAVVVATGVDTEIGKISQLIGEVEEEVTPLQLKLLQFSRYLTMVIVIISILIFVQGYLVNGNLVEMFLMVVALAVSAIPEGLLVAVTIILTIGMQFILKRQALVRKLVAAETLGSISVICTDKTGTLTEGIMRANYIVTSDQEYDLKKIAKFKEEMEIDMIGKISALCSSAEIQKEGSDLEDSIIIGEPTEIALMSMALKMGYNKYKLKDEFKIKQEIPFNSERKYMAVKVKNDEEYVFVKGAPERVLSFCKYISVNGEKKKINKNSYDELLRKHEQLTSKGLRVLGFGYKTGEFGKLNDEMKDLVFVGFVAIKDPLRPEAKETIKFCQLAGIRPVIITGDHKLTAKAIFEELGIKVNGHILEGQELDKWTDVELLQKVDKIDIYARVEPKHKLRIISAWQERGEVVAMTGDGINDAPAIKASDIGVAFGSGSDVTKETADIVLLDNSFKTIVAAIEQGRIIFDNIRKVILYLLADSFSEILIIAGSLLLNLPIPIVATQILWINLIGDGLPGIAMSMEPGEDNVMKHSPRKKTEPIFNKKMKILIFAGVFADLFVLGLYYLLVKNSGMDLGQIRTIIFAILGIDSLFYAFSIRNLRHSIFAKNPFSNKFLVISVLISLVAFVAVIYVPFLQKPFHTVSLGIGYWGFIIGFSLFKILIIEGAKKIVIKKELF